MWRLLNFPFMSLFASLPYERQEIIRILQGVRLTEYAHMLPPEEKASVLQLAGELEAASRAPEAVYPEFRLSTLLLDQGQELLDFLYSQAVPNKVETYSSKGSMYKQRPGLTAFREMLNGKH